MIIYEYDLKHIKIKRGKTRKMRQENSFGWQNLASTFFLFSKNF